MSDPTAGATVVVPGSDWVGVGEEHPFGLQTCAFGSFTAPGDPQRRLGVRIGEDVLDLTAAGPALGTEYAPLFACGTLDRLLAAGSTVWEGVRAHLQTWLSDEQYRPTLEPCLWPVEAVSLALPFTVADFADFYASEHHARNLGRMFRPGQPELTPNWKHLPIGYHGRAGTVVASGTEVVRPRGQRRGHGGEITVGPSARLDIEAELGFVVGTPTALGSRVSLADFSEHVFGVCLVNDWSARDIQAWEYAPLGPFLGKSFATSVGGWVVPLAALQQARVAPPPRDPQPVAYLDDTGAEPWGLDITLEVALNGEVLSRPPCAGLYWTGAQQLAHLTVNGAALRTGDLFASGTVSGPERDQRGCLIELSWGGEEPVRLADGGTRSFLEDGDEVVITGTAPGPGGSRIGLGEVRGRVVPAH